MTSVLQKPEHPIALWKSGAGRKGLSSLLGEEPLRVRLDRVNFPGKRPIQLNFTATLRSGTNVPVYAEHVPKDAEAYAARVTASLRKSRYGQSMGLSRSGVVADSESGLVLRGPGLDERLPALRLLYDQDAARRAVARITGQDPGPVTVRIAAQRLGKRAVLRIETSQGRLFARLRAVKSEDGTHRFARHEALWTALGVTSRLRIPEPLGALPELGLSLFRELPGVTPDFGTTDGRAINHALDALCDLELADLPGHRGRDEARLLRDWLMRCNRHLPELALLVEPQLNKIVDQLTELEDELRPCHRDLHEKQILVAGGIAGILDFDTLSMADPGLDPGNLLAHLFLAGQDERPIGSVLNRPRVALWRKAALLRLAMIYGFTSTPDAVIRRLLDEVAR